MNKLIDKISEDTINFCIWGTVLTACVLGFIGGISYVSGNTPAAIRAKNQATMAPVIECGCGKTNQIEVINKEDKKCQN